MAAEAAEVAEVQESPRKRWGLFTRPKARRWRRGMVSLDESLLAADKRLQPFQPTQPLVRVLSVPLCAPTMVTPPVGGESLIARLEARDVMSAPSVDPALTAVLLGFAQLRPQGAKKVVLTRAPSEDVVVRLYNEVSGGLIAPIWILVRRHAEVIAERERTVNEQSVTEAAPPTTSGVQFCQYLYKAVAPVLRLLLAKPMALKIASLVRAVTGRNLAHLASANADQAWEQLMDAICARRPVYAVSKETNPQHQRHRRFSALSALTVVEAFELRGERYVCVYDSKGAVEGHSPAPRDVQFDEFMSEIDGLYAVA